ncbi:hypothetical protein [Priestia megaterium]|uniref:hypothetical protein n=1 Tax=Priestia megaterium TaxID=1404 RepID=UPI0017810911|nr:hypothetical protein [Priestia megaterium]MBD8848530.1 hypothetical protein [Priestia megaterium]
MANKKMGTVKKKNDGNKKSSTEKQKVIHVTDAKGNIIRGLFSGFGRGFADWVCDTFL